MKMRNGFVSNSSSSSFIVGFPKKPQTKEEMKELVFNGAETFVYDNAYPNARAYSADVASNVLFSDFEYSRRKIIASLLRDFRNETSYYIDEIAREDIEDNSALYLQDEEFVTSGSRSRQYMNEIVAKLTEFNPDINWEEMLNNAVKKIAAAHKKHKALGAKKRKLELELRKKHDLPHFGYKDTSKMSRQAKAKYEQQQKAHDVLEEKYIEKNPKYIAIEAEEMEISKIIYPWREKRGSACYEFAKGLTRIFLKENNENVLAIISLADEDGDLPGAMEHGNIFSRLNHLRFSHH